MMMYMSEQKQLVTRKRKDAKPSKPPKITNMVFTGRFKWWSPYYKLDALPLTPFVLCTGGHMNHKSFKSCVIKLWDPRVTMHIYANGKFTVCGAQSTTDAIQAVHDIISIVGEDNELGLILEMYRFKLHNVVVQFTAGFPIDIDAFWYHNQWNTLRTPKYSGFQHYPKWPIRHPCYVIHKSGATNGVGTESYEAAVDDYTDLKLDLYTPGSQLSQEYRKTLDVEEEVNSSSSKKRKLLIDNNNKDE